MEPAGKEADVTREKGERGRRVSATSCKKKRNVLETKGTTTAQTEKKEERERAKQSNLRT